MGVPSSLFSQPVSSNLHHTPHPLILFLLVNLIIIMKNIRYSTLSLVNFILFAIQWNQLNQR